MLHNKMYLFCQVDFPGINGIFTVKTLDCSLTGSWMPRQPSWHFCCLAVQARQVTYKQQNWYLYNWEVQHKALKPGVEKSHFQSIWVTLCSPAGACVWKSPQRTRSLSSCASVRVAGDLSHFSVKVLPTCHWWKAWSFAIFTMGTLLSSLPNMPQQNRAMTHPLIFAFLRHRGLFQRLKGTAPFGVSFLRFNPTAICLLGSLRWHITGHSKSHFSQPQVHNDQYLPLPYFFLIGSVVTDARSSLSPWEVPLLPWHRVASRSCPSDQGQAAFSAARTLCIGSPSCRWISEIATKRRTFLFCF